MMIQVLLLGMLLILGDFDVETLAPRAIALGEKERLRLLREANEEIDVLETIKKTKVSVEFNKKKKAEKEKEQEQKILSLKRLAFETSFDVVDLDSYSGNSMPIPKLGDICKTSRIYVKQIDEKSFLGEFPPINERPQFYFSGFDTSKLIDNAGFDFKGLLFVVGPHSYTTVLNAKKTILEIRPVTEKELQSLKEAISAMLPHKVPREWSDLTGKHKTTATLAELDQKNVKLFKPDGKTVVIPLLQMSKEDQKIIRVELGLEKYPMK